MNRKKCVTSAGILAALLASLGCRATPPPPPGGPPPPPQVSSAAPAGTGSQQTVTDVVRSFNYGPGGQVDGLILNRGIVVHFPPEWSGQVTPMAPAGATVTATGWLHTGPAGDTVLDAQTISNNGTRASVNVPAPPALPLPPGVAGYSALAPPAPPPPPPPPPPLPGGAGTQQSVTDVVRSFNYGPGGQADGLILNRGIVVHFPPELSGQVKPMAPAGATVTAAGWLHTGPAGATLLDAQTITNNATRASVNMPAPPAPPPPGGAAAPPPPPPPGVAGYAAPAPPPLNAAPAPTAGPPPLPPAPAAPGPVATQEFLTRTSSIRQWNYGPTGEVNGFLLANGMLATVPPDLGAQLRSAARIGSRVTVRGYPWTGVNGRSILSVQSVTVNSQTLGVGAPVPGAPAEAAPPPPPGA